MLRKTGALTLSTQCTVVRMLNKTMFSSFTYSSPILPTFEIVRLLITKKAFNCGFEWQKHKTWQHIYWITSALNVIEFQCMFCPKLVNYASLHENEVCIVCIPGNRISWYFSWKYIIVTSTI